MGGNAARRGFQRETLFVNLINHNNNFRQQIERALQALNVSNGFIKQAIDVKSSCKSDVKLQLEGADGQIIELGCSLKAAEANFNQLDRRWLANWAEILEMPDEVRTTIQSSLDRKIARSRDIFILPTQKDLVLPFFESKKETIFKELFTREDENLKLFIAYDEKNAQWYISKVDDIIRYLNSQIISTTKMGVVTFGESLTLQRKGGDGNIKTVPKSSPLHPSNQLQFKIKPLTIINNVPTIKVKE